MSIDSEFEINNAHHHMVERLMKPGHVIVDQLTPEKADLMHAVVGVSGEAGELLDAVKKFTIYGKTLDMANMIEELGDLEFYLRRVRQIIGVSHSEVLIANMQKLGERYSSGSYSDEQAIARADKG
jgi:NTP pyrophosphatase (non-canonical NTP hydrolase)